MALAAVAAHWPLGEREARMLREAVQMQGWHALALLACGLWRARGGRLVDVAGAAFVIGQVSFSGAIASLVFAGVSPGPAAPIGGTVLMLGWLALALSTVRAGPSH